METRKMPVLTGESGLNVLRNMLRSRSILAGLSAMHAALGSPFRITLPVFRPVVLAGPEASRWLLVRNREQFNWRTESDPITKLLRRGVLVTDGPEHDRLREIMDPSLHRGRVNGQVAEIWQYTNLILDTWQDGETRDMLVEMRRAALLILIGSLFGEDATADLDRIWTPILISIAYISPGPWILWPDIPRPGYRRHLAELDRYLYELIERKRRRPEGNDLLAELVRLPELDDGLIRDQLLTMLIAGHDTSTALLAWTLYLFGEHPEALHRAREEVDALIGSADRPPSLEELRGLRFLDAVLKECLRLYPPIHIGSRRAAEDTSLDGCPIPHGDRVMYSIYLTHRDPAHWPDPDAFRPERFLEEKDPDRPAFAYIPFGGGPRNCIGAAFSQVESKIVLARILQRFDLFPTGRSVHPHMGATLEPRPGVPLRIRLRDKDVR